MNLIHPDGTKDVHMDPSISPYISRPNRTGAMCLTEDVVSWWMGKVSDPSCVSYLEIGSFDGVLLSLMAEKYPKVQFFAIDPFMEGGNTGNGHYGYWYINNKNLPNVTLYLGKSEDCLPHIAADGHKFSCIFVDGDHSYECVIKDMVQGWELLHPNGFMACHDFDMPGVIQACEEFSKNHPFVMALGMPVFIKP